MSRTEVAVAVVGAGPAGLSAAAALKRRGVEAVLFDEDDGVGGRWSRRYERLCLHTVRRFSGLAHHRMPRSYPRYAPKDLVARYLEDYAERFGLDVRLRHHVDAVRPANGRWQIQTSAGTWQARVVVLATGHYNRPVLPSWPGASEFRGRVLHAGDYRTGREFSGRRVLVVGLGNTGAELAADLAEQGAAAVAVAVRTPPPIVPRDVLGLVPVQLLGLLLARVPAPRLLDRVGALMRRVAVGDLSGYGLGPAGWGPFSARRPAVIDVGFLDQLRQGCVSVRPALDHLTATTVVFADGSEESFDVVVAATGYRTALGEILDLPAAVDQRGMPRFASGRPTPFPGLYFIGFDETVGGHLHRANVESRRLAKEICSYLERSATPNGAGSSSA